MNFRRDCYHIKMIGSGAVHGFEAPLDRVARDRDFFEVRSGPLQLYFG